MTKHDDELARFYEDSAHLRPAGPPVRKVRSRRALESHVPVRFSAETVAMARLLAAEEGITVSSWIRRLVAREIAVRMPTVTTADATVAWSWTEPPKPPSVTTTSAAELEPTAA